MRAELIVSKLKEHGVTHVVGLPDNGTRALFERLWSDDSLEVVTVTREGEAFALASGLWLGHQLPVVIIQNTGLLETGDAFRGTAYNMGVPLVMLVGYRGYGSLEPGAPKVDTAASFLEPTLKAWNIPYSVAVDDEVGAQIDQAFQQTGESSLPAAVLLAAETV